jgi:GNAT superfamily N-acetyltransferase
VTITEQGLVLRTVPYTAPDAQRLVAATLADLARRYGGNGDATPVDPDQFSAPRGTFVVAYLDGVPVGCGGWRSRGDDAEIKRMYTAPEARGRGVARAVLLALEDSARAAGRRRMILETGSRQPEAIGLYESRGYLKIPNFGYYKDEPGAVCYGLELAGRGVGLSG